jgi:DNA gyrase/topoisomerase IV subunit A
MGDPQQRCLLASDAGYGFVTTLGDLQAKNRAGKAVLTLPAGARVVSPVALGESGAWVAAVSNEGRLLVFPLNELPSLSRGKGNKIIGYPRCAGKIPGGIRCGRRHTRRGRGTDSLGRQTPFDPQELRA